MSTDQSYVMVDCEQLLSYSLQRHLTIPPSFFTQVNLKNGSLRKMIHTLSTNSNVSIIFVTTCPFTQLIKDYLKLLLPGVSFSVIFAPPLHINLEKITQTEKFQEIQASMSPPTGYTLLIDRREFSNEEALQGYTTTLLQRLLQTDRFYDTRVKNISDKKENQTIALTQENLMETVSSYGDSKCEEQEKIKQHKRERIFCSHFFKKNSTPPRQEKESQFPSQLSHTFKTAGPSNYFKPITEISSGVRTQTTGTSPVKRILLGKEVNSFSPRHKLSTS